MSEYRLVPRTANIFVTADGTFYERQGARYVCLPRQPAANERGVMVIQIRRFGYNPLPYLAAELVLLAHGKRQPSQNHIVRYRDGDRSNIALTNLYWCDITRRAAAGARGSRSRGGIRSGRSARDR